ncbi:MAG: HD domain-containing protein [Clostridia bacterium]|nr:HD domain-containing protein [Clostridia bacterium]
MINETQAQSLAALRERIRSYMSGKRLSHTYAVEREITVLSALYAPEMEFTLRAAALLHDITKELSLEKQLQLCDEFDIIYTQEEALTPKIFHSRTAAAVIRRDFSEYASDEILSAIRWHTTGHAAMTLGEQLLFLADYIEDTRTFESCVELRRFFYNGIEKAGDAAARDEHLRDTMILSFDMTIRELLCDGKPIHVDTVEARNYFVCRKRGA